MKQNKQDDRLAQLLKQQAHQPVENEWFTPRVLGKLPERAPRRSWWPIVLLVAAIVVCAVCWGMVVRDYDYRVLTVRDVVHFIVLVVLTIVVLWQCIVALIHTAES